MAEETKSEGGGELMFPSLNADEDPEVTVIESLCLSCRGQGTTRLMLTKIPFFKEVIITSFRCDECGHSDTGIQSAGRIQEKAIKLTVNVKDVKDLNRQVVKADCAVFAIPSLDFEQPPLNKKGEINTIEGLIDGVINGLMMLQPQRREVDAKTAEKIDEFIEKLKKLKLVSTPFDVVIDDPAGNSFIENFNAPSADPQLKIEHYKRDKAADVLLGLAAEDEDEESDSEAPEDFKKEVLTFRTNCSNCNSPCDTNMKLVEIPFFKEVVIMCTVCDVCGTKDNEVKGASGIEPKGTKITLNVTDPTDMSRDVLKSDMCGLRIPEMEFELVEGTLGGKFTTLEGLLTNIIDQLSGTSPTSVGLVGDSPDTERQSKMKQVLEDLRQISKGEKLGVHIILDDPAGNSYLQNVYAPDPDPEMIVEHYERNEEQREILGLNDMITENYRTDEDKDNLANST